MSLNLHGWGRGRREHHILRQVTEPANKTSDARMISSLLSALFCCCLSWFCGVGVTVEILELSPRSSPKPASNSPPPASSPGDLQQCGGVGGETGVLTQGAQQKDQTQRGHTAHWERTQICNPLRVAEPDWQLQNPPHWTPKLHLSEFP